MVAGLDNLCQYSFVDKKLFGTNRTTGDIEIRENDNGYRVMEKNEKYFRLEDIKGLKLTNIIITAP